MTVLVFHADGDRLTGDQRYEVMAGFRPTHADYCVDLFAQGLYAAVAVLDTDSLDAAYRLTNSVDQPWYAAGDERVNYLLPPGTGCRSTSVGDVLLCSATMTIQLVSSVGFTDVTAAMRAKVPPELMRGYVVQLLEYVKAQLTGQPETVQ